MNEPAPLTGRPPSDGLRRLLLLALAAAAYIGLPAIRGEKVASTEQFVLLADSFLHGRLDLAPPPAPQARLAELIPSEDHGRFYCPYPPFPAVLLMPFVALLGTGVSVATACRVVSVLNVLLFDACLPGVARLLGHPMPAAGPRLAYNLLFAFGTVAWHNATMGGDWHLAHAVAMSAMLLALRESVGRNRQWLVGIFVGLTIMTRPTAGLACLFFALPLFKREAIRRLAALAAGPIAAAALIGAYNYARFANPFDFGYDRMLLVGKGKELLDTFGQFNPVFVPQNLFWFFLAPPWPRLDVGFPWLGYDPRGMSLFLATPAALWALAAVGSRRSSTPARHAAFSIAFCLAALLTYFNTGFVQFGHRFSMDYLPLLMSLVVAGMGARPSRLAYAAISVSIACQIWGTVWARLTWLPDYLVPGLP